MIYGRMALLFASWAYWTSISPLRKEVVQFLSRDLSTLYNFTLPPGESDA